MHLNKKRDQAIAPEITGWFLASGGRSLFFWKISFIESTSFMYCERMSVNFFIISELIASRLLMFLNFRSISKAPSADLLDKNNKKTIYNAVNNLRKKPNKPQLLERLVNENFGFVLNF